MNPSKSWFLNLPEEQSAFVCDTRGGALGKDCGAGEEQELYLKGSVEQERAALFLVGRVTSWWPGLSPVPAPGEQPGVRQPGLRCGTAMVSVVWLVSSLGAGAQAPLGSGSALEEVSGGWSSPRSGADGSVSSLRDENRISSFSKSTADHQRRLLS